MDGGLMKTTSKLALLAAAGLMFGGAAATSAEEAKKKPDPAFDLFADQNTPFTFAGITIYGTVDVGYSSLTHGSSPSDVATVTQPFVVQKWSNGSTSSLVQSPLEQSKLGIKGTEKIVDDWSLVFKAETGFDPLSFKLVDGLKSLTNDNGPAQPGLNAIPPGYIQQADSSRAGQIFQGAGWGGISNKTLGTLTYGRQNAILFDALQAADPMNAAGAFGLIGYSGTVGGGAGDTEDARLDNSIRYANTIGDASKTGAVRVGAEYQFAQVQEGGVGYQLGLGFDYKGFSLDGVYVNKASGIAASTDTKAYSVGTNLVGVTISDNTAYAVTARYDGGIFKLFAGYENISQANPSNTMSLAGGDQIIGGYVVDGNLITTSKYTASKVAQMEWLGAKVNIDPKFAVTGAYYHLSQNDYTNSAVCSGANGNLSSGSCAGTEDVYSILLDYQATKRWDVYGGAMYSKVNDGLASGFTNTDNTAVTVGSRFKF